MQFIKELLTALLALLPASAAPRAIQCAHKIHSDPDQRSVYTKRLKNIIIFIIVAESALAILELAFDYLGG